MKVLFTASEAAPFAKVGGLADVVGSLPAQLGTQGIDARVIIPKYKTIPQQYTEQMHFLGYYYISMGWRRQYVGIFTLMWRNVTVYFVDNEYYFGGTAIYGYIEGEAEKYAFFCRAVLESFSTTGFQPDIIHCNDWQTALIPVLLKTQYRWDIRTVLTIHNLKFQGIFGQQVLKDLLSLPDELFDINGLEFYGGASFLKGGILFADRVTTVSPTYAKETLGEYFGEKLNGVLKSREDVYSGILNGIDYQDYNPASDTLICSNYSVKSFAKKKENKCELQKMLGLEVTDVPVIALISRLYEQKGIDLIKEMLGELLFQCDFQFVLLGTGERGYEEYFSSMAQQFPSRISTNLKYDNALSHKIYAGADIFLMPSRFEPCGLSQLIAMKYGTVPVVRSTGGLGDTVIDASENGWGFVFENFNAHEMAAKLREAICAYGDGEKWKKLALKAMRCDFSWEKSATKYIELYESILKGSNCE